jgi:hypothetical protein
MTNGTRRGWGVSVTPRPLFIPGKDSVPIVQEAGWAPRPVWTGAENLAPTRIRFTDRPAPSQSLYRLSYPAPRLQVIRNKIMYIIITSSTFKPEHKHSSLLQTVSTCLLRFITTSKTALWAVPPPRHNLKIYTECSFYQGTDLVRCMCEMKSLCISI